MITNEKQYKISKAQAQKFYDAYKNFDTTALLKKGIAKELVEAQKESLLIQYKELAKMTSEYEELKSGVIQYTEAKSLDEMPTILIKSRISQGLTQEDLAKKLGLKQQQIQRYEADMYSTANFKKLTEIAHTLGVELKNEAKFLLDANNENIWKKFPIKEMFERGWFTDFKGTLEQAVKNSDELVSEFFSQVGINAISALHKKKVRTGSTINKYSLLAWQARIVQKAFFTSIPGTFDIKKIDNTWIRNLVRLSREKEGPLLAKNYLEKYGIHLVIEKHLEGTHLDGAAIRGANNEPIIGMTLRYDKIDTFWFVLLHELGHIIMHIYGKDPDNQFIDEDLENDDDEDLKEIEANTFARESLIPTEEWEVSSARFLATKGSIVKQAENWGISEAIIAGRILRETGNYKSSPELLSMLGNNKVRYLFEG